MVLAWARDGKSQRVIRWDVVPVLKKEMPSRKQMSRRKTAFSSKALVGSISTRLPFKTCLPNEHEELCTERIPT